MGEAAKCGEDGSERWGVVLDSAESEGETTKERWATDAVFVSEDVGYPIAEGFSGRQGHVLRVEAHLDGREGRPVLPAGEECLDERRVPGDDK